MVVEEQQQEEEEEEECQIRREKRPRENCDPLRPHAAPTGSPMALRNAQNSSYFGQH